VVLPAALSSQAPSLHELAEHLRPVVLAREAVVPVLEPFRRLLPDAGLVRGSTLAIGGVGATSLALHLVAGASQAGSWVAIVGLNDLAPVAVVEAGIDISRVAFIDPGGSGRQVDVVAALIGAVDIVMVDARLFMSSSKGRRLASRGRERGSILMTVSPEVVSPSPWPVDLSLLVHDAQWEGLGHGHGHLRSRRARVDVDGRGRASRPVQRDVLLPAIGGHVTTVERGPEGGTVVAFSR